jgi:tetratricopeptide (TPR) repeat protein
MSFRHLRVAPGRQEIWTVAPAPCGPGCILVAHQAGAPVVRVIAPPAVRLRPGEAEKHCNQWRVARYDAANPDELLIAIGSHVPGTVQNLTAQDVGTMVPTELQDWVSRVCDRQLALADGFGRQDPRLAPIEAQARAAATRYAELAGPAESSRRAKAELEHAPAEVPDTVAELLDCATGQTRPESTPLRAQDHLDTALNPHKHTPSVRRPALDVDHVRLLAQVNGLARALLADGDLDTALKFHKQTLEIFRRALRADDDGLLAVIDLARALSADGDHDTALKLVKHTLEICQRELGDDHQTRTAARPHRVIDLVSALSADGDHDTALKLVKHTLEICQRELGDDHQARTAARPHQRELGDDYQALTAARPYRGLLPRRLARGPVDRGHDEAEAMRQPFQRSDFAAVTYPTTGSNAFGA